MGFGGVGFRVVELQVAVGLGLMAEDETLNL